MKFLVIENRNIGTIGHPEFKETLLFEGTKEECIEFEDAKRKEYKDRTLVDCFIQSQEERYRMSQVNNFWNSLTDYQRRETIVVNGKTYFKALYEFHRNKGE